MTTTESYPAGAPQDATAVRNRPEMVIPEWVRAIRSHSQSRSAHQFLLHFNINDYILDYTTVRPIKEYLVRLLREHFLIVTYSLSSGLAFPGAREEDWHNPQMEQAMQPLLTLREAAANAPQNARPGQSDAREFRDLSARGKASLTQAPADALPAVERAMRQDCRRMCVILEYVEKLAPAGNADREQLVMIETLQRWAIDQEFSESGHLILLVAAERAQVAPCVVGANSGTVDIQVPLPSAEERRAFLNFLYDCPEMKAHPLPPGMTLDRLTGQTVGFSLRDIMNLARTSVARGQAMDSDLITARKKDIIRMESHGLLQVVETRHGLETIGGLAHVKEYLTEQISRVRRFLDLSAIADESQQGRAALKRALSLVPRGVLFAGPPGTGKTILAEALAQGSGLNMVKLQDVRSMWVGESERNLSKVFDLLIALQPVLVFVDEIDQAIGSRSGGGTQGSDVDQRLFGKILEFMGDGANRGRVIWVAATNRPDYLDAAMLRRFDRVIPILPPDEEERAHIIKSMTLRLGVTLAPDTDVQAIARATDGLTGAGIEVITRRAAELAPDIITTDALLQARRDYKPNHDPQTYDLQSLLAMQAANFYSTMPREMPINLRRIMEACQQEQSSAPLEDAIRELQQRHRTL